MAEAGRRVKMKEGLQIATLVVTMAVAMVAWYTGYVAPKDQLMAATQTCVEKRIDGVRDTDRYQIEKREWAKCWAELSKDQDWIWSDVSRPRKQGEPR